MFMVFLDVRIYRNHEHAVLPVYATDQAAGFDLHAAEEIVVYPGQTVKVRTGLIFEIPICHMMSILPRSGVSLKTKLRVLTGTIDADFRGEVHIIIENIGEDMKRISVGDRIAQGVVVPVNRAKFRQVEHLEDLSITARGSGGFGHTGMTSQINPTVENLITRNETSIPSCEGGYADA